MIAWYDLVSHYGYIGIFLLLTLGIIGLPVPDEILLTYLGYVTSIGAMHFSLTFMSALLGAVVGISISYLLGIKLGEPFLRKYGPKFFITESRLKQTNKLFSKYGSFVLFVCYFIPGVRHIAAYVAGITRYSFRRFSLFAYVGAFVWVLFFLLLGNRLGSNWNIIASFFSKYFWYFILVLVLIATVLTIFYVNRNRKKSCL